MDEPGLKKLVTGFLVLAILISSGAFALSDYFTTKADRNKDSSPSLLKNYFSKNKPKNLNTLPGDGSDNMTKDLADTIAEQILLNNKLGPIDQNGLKSIDVPENLDSIVESYINKANLDDSVFAIDEKRIRTTKSLSPDDTRKYLSELNKIFSKFSGKEYQNLKRASSLNRESALGAVNLFYSQIEQELYSLTSPATTLHLHKSLLKFAVIMNTSFAENNFRGDPLKALTIIEEGKALLSENSSEALKEINLLKYTLSKNVDAAPTSVADIFAIKVANAQLITYDPVNWYENLLDQIASWENLYLDLESWYGVILTEQLKDRLLKALVDAILNWVGAGGNEPLFVTNWQDYLEKSFKSAAGDLISKSASNFCSDFRDGLAGELKELTGGGGFGSYLEYGNVGCPLESLVNTNEFYNNFYAGGWDAYGLMTLPSSNYYGTKYFSSQSIIAEAESIKESAKAKAVAGSGYTGTETCEGGASPVAGKCADGSKPEVTTPGQVSSDLTSKSLGASIERIVNAQDWQSLASQLVNFAITKVMASGNKGLRGSTTGSTKPDQYSVCKGFPVGSPDYLSCIDNVNKSKNTGSANGGHAATVLSEAERMKKSAENALGSVILAIDIASSSIATLNQIVANESACPAPAATAKRELEAMNADYLRLLAKADSLMSKIDFLTTFLSEVEAHEPKDDFEYYTTKRDELRSFGTPASFAREEAEARQEAMSLQTKLSEISELLKQCVAF